MKTRRYAPAISFFGLCHAAMGSNVLYTSLAGGVPMSPTTHGTAIYAVPAEFWGIVVMFSGLGMMLGVAKRWLYLTLVAAFVGAFLNGFLVYFASSADFGFIVRQGAAVLTILHLSIALSALDDIMRGAIAKAWWRKYDR